MELLTLLLLPVALVASTSYMPTKEALLTDALLREVTGGLLDPAYLDLGDSGPVLASRNLKDLKDLEALDYELADEALGPLGPLSPHPSTRDGEYLQHSTLWGHQYTSGGAGEGRQHLRPDGALKNSHQVKTDATLPAYCNPPNPCPVGFTAEDGCMEEFDNTAAFSRDYQAAQDCMCDREHMFKCAKQSKSRVETRNDLSDADIERFVTQFQGEHKSLVAKKFHVKKASIEATNPYLQGERLPVAAKKGFNVQ